MTKSVAMFGAAATAAIALLAACSGATPQAGTATLPSSEMTGRGASAFARQAAAGHELRPAAARAETIYVDDSGYNAVDVVTYNRLHHRWRKTSTIGAGINNPGGNWVDKLGNLYVANYSAQTVTEYNLAGSLIFTYSSGIAGPVDVTTDKNGNVFEADYNSAGSGYINEYAQGSNTVMRTCSPGGNVEGVAVDVKGDVFVDYWNGSNGQLAIYFGGLAGCNETVLGEAVAVPGGMVLDDAADIIIADQTGAVYVFEEPLYSVKKTLGSGFVQPYHVTLDAKNDAALIGDVGNSTVQILSYPSGNNITTLTKSNGISVPASAVYGANYVP